MTLSISFVGRGIWVLALIISVANAWLPSFAPMPSSSAGRNIHPRNHHDHPSNRDHMRRLRQSSRAMDGISEPLTKQLPEHTATNDYSNNINLELPVGLHPHMPLRSVDTYTNPPREFTPFQQFARAAPIMTMLVYAIHPQPLDHCIEQIWAWVYSWDITHTGLFEAHVASFSFVLFIAAYSFLHILLGEETTKRHRLDGQVPQENPLAWATLTWEGFQLWFNPLVGYLVSIWLYQQIFHTYQPPPMLAPTFGVLVVEVLVGVFLYDLFFCPMHVLFHKGALKNIRSVHGYHHRHNHGALNSIETVQNSFLDGGLQVLCNILVQHISPFGHKHLLSRVIHNIIVTYMLTETHSGYNFSWMSHNIWPEFLGGAPRHERHHNDGRVYYQQFFTYIDDAMGWTDHDVQEQLQRKQQRQQIVSTDSESIKSNKEPIIVSRKCASKQE